MDYYTKTTVAAVLALLTAGFMFAVGSLLLAVGFLSLFFIILVILNSD